MTITWEIAPKISDKCKYIIEPTKEDKDTYCTHGEKIVRCTYGACPLKVTGKIKFL